MPNDYITINALTRELNNILSGCKIRKISQPEKDEIVLSLFNGRTNLLFVLSANPNNPKIYISSKKKENIPTAPPLLMILRKYIGTATIANIETINHDRIVCINLHSRNELFDNKKYKIICELMGRYSNIILLDENNTILDSLWKLVPNDSQRRCILPGAIYAPPEQTKIFLGDVEEIMLGLSNCNDMESFLKKNVSGVSPISAQNILVTAKKLGLSSPRSIANICAEYSDIYSSRFYAPCYTIGEQCDFYATKMPNSISDNLINCAEIVYRKRETQELKQANAKTLETIIKNAIKKQEKIILQLKEKLIEANAANDIRKKAELITCNLYQINSKANSINVIDYETQQEITISLDKTMSASQYAQKLFKKYTKLKRGKQINLEMLEKAKNELAYCEELMSELSLVETLDDINLVKEEMESVGLIKTQLSTKYKIQEHPSYLIFEIEGFKIYCGKNGLQNEHITFKIGKENDLWLHVSKAHGSHVIISSEKKDIPNKVLLFSAEIAAYYSEKRNDSTVVVDYTLRKNVKRHPSKKIGLVTYSSYNSINAKPNAHIESSK